MEYVELLNMHQKGDVDCVLVGPPKSIDMHWDSNGKLGRTEICSANLGQGLCPWCEKEQAPRSYFYAPCVFITVCDDHHQKWAKAIVQLPMGFVASSGKKLVAGRRVSVKGLRVDGRIPFWQAGGLIDPPCAPFDVFDVLCRIKGIKKAKAASPELQRFPRIGEVG